MQFLIFLLVADTEFEKLKEGGGLVDLGRLLLWLGDVVFMLCQFELPAGNLP